MANILIGDDHAVVRMAVRILLEGAGHTIVGEAGCGVDVLDQSKRSSPDIVILDIDLPRLDGMKVLERLCIERHIKVVIFTGLSAEQYALRCARAGAVAFVSKEDDLFNLSMAVRAAQSGYKTFPTTDSSSVEKGDNNDDEESVIEKLSSRELSVLRYLARGYRIKDIAEALLISEKTASTYKARLTSKLRIKNNLEIAEFARRNGLA